MKRLTLVTLFLVAIAAPVAAQIVDPQNVLIRNVHLIEPGEDGDPVVVNILVQDNKLEIVSQDEIPVPDGIIPVNAAGGYLIGALEVGSAPKFIILDSDPAGDFNILMDTDAHIVFAVNEGELVRNNLFEDFEAITVSEETEKQGWLAYTPPPMALPSNYGDSSKWNQWQTKNTTGILLGAAVLDRQQWLSQNGASEQQVGDLSDFEGGEIRALRVGVVGILNYFERPWVYTLFGATNAFDKGFETENLDGFTWFDYRLDMPVSDNMTLSVGKQKEPMSMERSMSMIQLPMQERTSVSDAFMPSRNFGAVLSGRSLSQRVTWAGGVFNNFIDSGESMSDTSTALVGRVTWLPFMSDDESNLVHLGFGARHSNGKQGVRYSTEPEYNKAPIFVDTGEIGADSIDTYNFEASWRKGPIWLASEYVASAVDSPTSGDLDFSGYHLTASWILSGEMRSYNKKAGILGPIPIAKDVNQGGWGAWEVGARYSSIDLSDRLVDGGEMDVWSLGINWWLTPVFNVNLNYRIIENDSNGLSGDSSGFMGRILLMLE